MLMAAANEEGPHAPIVVEHPVAEHEATILVRKPSMRSTSVLAENDMLQTGRESLAPLLQRLRIGRNHAETEVIAVRIEERQSAFLESGHVDLGIFDPAPSAVARARRALRHPVRHKPHRQGCATRLRRSTAACPGLRPPTNRCRRKNDIPLPCDRIQQVAPGLGSGAELEQAGLQRAVNRWAGGHNHHLISGTRSNGPSDRQATLVALIRVGPPRAGARQPLSPLPRFARAALRAVRSPARHFLSENAPRHSGPALPIISIPVLTKRLGTSRVVSAICAGRSCSTSAPTKADRARSGSMSMPSSANSSPISVSSVVPPYLRAGAAAGSIRPTIHAGPADPQGGSRC